MISRVRLLIDGAVAGVLGAVVIALWYLIFDAARGQPLNTAQQYAATLFGEFALGMAHRPDLWALILGHLCFYFAVFALIGLATAMILETGEAEETLFPTMLVFVIVFDAFSIMIMMLLGPSGPVSLPWWKFILGDAAATAAILGYFLERHPVLAHRLQGPWVGVARQGTVAGIIGAFVVAVWFLIVDAASGQVFRTPAVLGAAIFQGIFNPARVDITTPLVAGYTALHFFAFIAFGIVTAILLRAADREPVFTIAAMLLLALFEVIFVGALAVFDRGALQLLGFWTILAGNLFAIVAMLFYFSRQHREWVPRLIERWGSL